MKRVILTVGITGLILTACKKKEPEITVPDISQESIYNFPTKPGSYWVYNWFSIDSNGVETNLNTIDSIFVLGDTLINGYNYAIYKQQYFGGNYGIGYQRDSSGYIVNNVGDVYFTYLDYNLHYDSGNNGIWDYYRHTLGTSASITVPVGTFESLISEHYVFNSNGAEVNDCGELHHSFNTYMVSGIGQVYHEAHVFSFEFQNECKLRVRRLVEYYVPE